MSITGGDREHRTSEEDHIRIFKLWRCASCKNLFTPREKVCAYCPRPPKATKEPT